jgi:hypothetical protein
MGTSRGWLWTGIGAIILVALVVCWLAFRGAPLGVGIVFTHNQTYPKAVFTAYVTNKSGRPILLSNAELYFQSDGQSESVTWSHWDGTFPIAPAQPLLPQAVASLSISVSEYERQGRLTFDYTCDAGLLRKAASPVVCFLVRRLGLRPQFENRVRPRNTCAWLANQGLLNGRVRRIYEGPWVAWETAAANE